MFLDNKYRHWHDAIIERARTRGPVDGYIEKHHVIPKSMGGTKESGNLVALTFREHFLVHWLLTKFVDQYNCYKMLMALFRMGQDHLRPERLVAGWQYARARKAARERIVSEETKRKASTTMKARGYRPTEEMKRHLSELNMGNTIWVGKKHTDASKQKMRTAKLGKKQSPEHIENAAATRRGKKWPAERCANMGKTWLGRKHTLETRARMSANRRGKKRGPLSDAHRQNMSVLKTQYYARLRAESSGEVYAH